MSRFTVTIPTENASILTIGELRSAAGVADNSQDDNLLALGRSVSAAVARQCAIAADGVNPPTVLRETCSETFRLSRATTEIPLSRRPVTSITSVVEDGATLGEDDYEVDTASGMLSRLTDDAVSYWPCGKITVVYVAGYATAPDDLKLAASKLATALWSETARDPSLKREDIPGVIEREYWVAPSDDPLLSQEISDLLSPYRQRWL